jgi:CYTH domain-containing protein
VRAVLQEPLPGVTGYHRLRSRRAGGGRHLDLHLTFEPALTIERAHALATEVEEKLCLQLPGLDVVIHLEPDSEAPPPGEAHGPSDLPGRARSKGPLESLSGHGFERKFLLAAPPELAQLQALGAEVTEIEQTYLQTVDPEQEERVRVRWRGGNERITWTRKSTKPGLNRELSEVEIDRTELNGLLERRDRDRHVIRKTRYSFVWGEGLCEVDFFALPVRLQVFEIELPGQDTPIALPDFIAIEREVTGEPEFLNHQIASALAAGQALDRDEWIASLAPGDPVWVFSDAGAGETAEYGEVAARAGARLQVRVRGRELGFDESGSGHEGEADLTLERPGAATGAPREVTTRRGGGRDRVVRR